MYLLGLGWRFLPWILLTDPTEAASPTQGNYHKSNLLLEPGGALWSLYLQGRSRVASRAWLGEYGSNFGEGLRAKSTYNGG